jgi:hypothetical protein
MHIACKPPTLVAKEACRSSTEGTLYQAVLHRIDGVMTTEIGMFESQRDVRATMFR